MKLTPWFPADVKPVRPGVYKVKTRSGRPWYRRWDGKVWFVGSNTPKDAASKIEQLWFIDSRSWRGLAEPPKGEMK
jgi:hypothetical protein